MAGPDDAPALRDLFEKSYPALMAGSYAAEVLERALPMLTRPNELLLASGRFFLVGEASGRALACGGWSDGSPWPGRSVAGHAHIRHFATHPDRTGEGLGRMIFERCLAGARGAGMNALDCYSSLNAEPFYAALGFLPVERVEIPLGASLRFPAVLMRREI